MALKRVSLKIGDTRFLYAVFRSISEGVRSILPPKEKNLPIYKMNNPTGYICAYFVKI
jgi:hypothetical protein